MGGRFMKCLGTPSIALLRHWRQLVHPLLPLSPLNLLLIHHLSSHERCLAPNGAPGGAVRGSRGAPAEASFLLRVQLRCRLDACQAALAPRTRVAATTPLLALARSFIACLACKAMMLASCSMQERSSDLFSVRSMFISLMRAAFS